MASQQKVYLNSRYYSVSTVDNWAKNSSNIYNINPGNVAIGSNYTTPQALLDVSGQVLLRTPIFRIGEQAGECNQSTGSIAIGTQAGFCNQDVSAIAIGFQAGMCNQSFHTVAMGFQAGMCNQRASAIAAGFQAGMINQGTNGIAMGYEAGQSNQGTGAIAIGYEAGQFSQGSFGVAIGWQAGQVNQSQDAIAAGFQAGQINQGTNAIAVGSQAGQSNQGQNSICIGTGAQSTFENSIVLDATDLPLFSDVSNGFFVKPIDVSTGVNNFLVYNISSGKISYNANSTKTFVIDHPIQENKYLVHACLEGPEAGVYYRGKGEITNNEFVEVALPEYLTAFTNLTNLTNLNVHITPLNQYNEYYGDMVDNKVRVYGKNGKFSWYLLAERQKINVEPNKIDVSVEGEGPYRFINFIN